MLDKASPESEPKKLFPEKRRRASSTRYLKRLSRKKVLETLQIHDKVTEIVQVLREIDQKITKKRLYNLLTVNFDQKHQKKTGLLILDELQLKKEKLTDMERVDFMKSAQLILGETFRHISEPIGIFGSFAHGILDPGYSKMPNDIDIATSPQGIRELYQAFQSRPDTIITEFPSVHDKYGPLKSIRFAGYLLINNRSIYFEAFGEGGTYEGEEFRGLYQLGDPAIREQTKIKNGIIDPRIQVQAHKKLDEIEKAKKPKKGGKVKKKRRSSRIKGFKRSSEAVATYDLGELMK